MRPDHPPRRCTNTGGPNNASMATCQLRMPVAFQTYDLDVILNNADINCKDHLDGWTLRTVGREC